MVDPTKKFQENSRIAALNEIQMNDGLFARLWLTSVELIKNSIQNAQRAKPKCFERVKKKTKEMFSVYADVRVLI